VGTLPAGSGESQVVKNLIRSLCFRLEKAQTPIFETIAWGSFGVRRSKKYGIKLLKLSS